MYAHFLYVVVAGKLQAWLSAHDTKQDAEAKGVSVAAASVWKFNKNVQAWLLRHIFSEEQVCE